LLIGHSDPEYARALAERLAAHEDVDVVGLAETPEEVVARAAEVAPDVVVLDIEMQGLDVTRDLQSIRDARPSTRIILLVGKDVPPETGADAFIRKGLAPAQLASSLIELASLVLGLGRQPPEQPR
jgi:two-component system response regulator DesR